MSTEANKDFIRRYLDAISGKPKTEAVLGLFIAEQPLIDHIMVCEDAFPLYNLITDEMIAEGDLVTVRGRVTGIHLGPLMNIAPTGKEVDFSIFITYRIADGKIVDHWMLTDNMTMMEQIGTVPSEA
jgi:predicted SnoaL-like aldol condensation-catalyzing enzyme